MPLHVTDDAGERMDLSVIVPMYREARRIGPTLDDLVPALRAGNLRSELILVNDGSDDATAQAVRPLLTDVNSGSLARVLLLDFAQNRGKGAAIRDGLAAARGHWRLTMDADNACRIDQLRPLLESAGRTGAALVAGSRRAAGARVSARPTRVIVGKVFHLVQRALGLDLLLDTQCGFKLYRADLVERMLPLLRENGYVFDVEHLLLARRLGFRVEEVGVEWTHRDGGQVNPLFDGLAMLADSVKLARRIRALRIERPQAPAVVVKKTTITSAEPSAAAR